MIKKLCLLLMIGALVLNFSACSDKDNDTDTDAKTKTNEEVKEDKKNKDDAEKAPAETPSTPDETEMTQEVPVPEKTNLIDTMDMNERTMLNTFLSNFSEAYFDNYPVGGIADNYNLVGFAFTHNLLNGGNKIIYTDEYMGISGDDVDDTLYRFFGKTVPHTSVNEWAYMDDGFYMPAAGGETYAYFSIAKDMYANADGTYTVIFDTFFDDSNPDTFMTSWYALTHQQASSRYSFRESGVAVVREKSVDGNNTYELVSYTIK